ncbi:helix-turn-helix domain-containing protein [Planctomicrobium sp. SH664]|uniref:helix-turn-helix domain-containing protein n=1 Tax=Planctomicrobium sp. SH664 TaxID=3448125 RepID=UPI003F5C441B
MSKKYLSLDEAAQLLSMGTDELIRLREKGEIRGFADRGTWKFKSEDVESLGRKRQADSHPEVPLFKDEKTTPKTALPFSAGQPTPPAKDDLLYDSDSDVRLVGGPELDLGFDSDSDVKLVGLDQTVTDGLGLGTDPELNLLNADSDSEVKLVGPDSDSDVGIAGSDSDSDVQLVGGLTDDEIPMLLDNDTGSDITLAPDPMKQSDSDVQLIPDVSSGDITFIGDDEDAVAIDFRPGSAIDESGISLGGDSALMLGESGISLEGSGDSGIRIDDEEGITLALDDDSGISISSGDSGISLESAESGISLDSTFGAGTVPMMDIVPKKDVAETQFELAAIKEDDDSSFDLRMDDGDTGVLDLGDHDDATLGDADFDVDGDDGESAEFEPEGDLDLETDGFEDEEGLDVFEPDDEAFAAPSGRQEYASSGARSSASDVEWGTGTFVMLTLTSLLMLACGAVMFDLVKNTATAADPNPVSGAMINAVGGLFK